MAALLWSQAQAGPWGASDAGTDKITALETCCDVTSQADVGRIVKETLDKFGRVDILVNTPGYSFRTDAADALISDWEYLMAVNLTGAFRCA